MENQTVRDRMKFTAWPTFPDTFSRVTRAIVAVDPGHLQHLLPRKNVMRARSDIAAPAPLPRGRASCRRVDRGRGDLLRHGYFHTVSLRRLRQLARELAEDVRRLPSRLSHLSQTLRHPDRSHLGEKRNAERLQKTAPHEDWPKSLPWRHLCPILMRLMRIVSAKKRRLSRRRPGARQQAALLRAPRGGGAELIARSNPGMMSSPSRDRRT
jgi:hypothetical protein